MQLLAPCIIHYMVRTLSDCFVLDFLIDTPMLADNHGSLAPLPPTVAATDLQVSSSNSEPLGKKRKFEFI